MSADTEVAGGNDIETPADLFGGRAGAPGPGPGATGRGPLFSGAACAASVGRALATTACRSEGKDAEDDEDDEDKDEEEDEEEEGEGEGAEGLERELEREMGAAPIMEARLSSTSRNRNRLRSASKRSCSTRLGAGNNGPPARPAPAVGGLEGEGGAAGRGASWASIEGDEPTEDPSRAGPPEGSLGWGGGLLWRRISAEPEPPFLSSLAAMLGVVKGKAKNTTQRGMATPVRRDGAAAGGTEVVYVPPPNGMCGMLKMRASTNGTRT